MKQSESNLASLPEDIAPKIASCLQEGDLCALGSCSRFWRKLCWSDFFWEPLTRQRWPSVDFSTKSSSVAHDDSPSLKGLRDLHELTSPSFGLLFLTSETRREMKQSECILASLPEDIALKIASCLQVGDLCALGSCSRFWRDLCGSDFLWESLTRQRWPSLDVFTESSSVDDHGDSSTLKRWRDFYVKWHTEMAKRSMSVVRQVEQGSFSDSLESGDHVKAIQLLKPRRLGFKDVEMFLFRPELNVLVNLVGLHYCILWLEVPAEHVGEALQNSKISPRQVCVKWLFNAFHMHVSLEDLTLPQEYKVFWVLHLGSILEDLRIQISVFHSTGTSCSFLEHSSL